MEKALEDIVRHFLLHETKSSQFEKQPDQQTENQNNNKSSEKQQEQQEVKEDDDPATEIQIDRVSVDQDEFVQNLYSCLAERGVLREVHAFLRQRLVEILKGTWPHLVVSGSSSATSLNTTAIKLIEDFLCCHKLLFTFSVLVTELNISNYTFKQDFGKMICKDAENILVDLNIKKDTELSRKILKLYFEKERTSLLECIIGVSSWGQCMDNILPEWPFMIPGDGVHNNDNNYDFYMENRKEKDYFNNNNNNQPHDVDECIAQQMNSIREPMGSSSIGVDSKFLQLQLTMEKDKQVQIKLAIQKFREEEARKLRDEIETRLKFEMIAKEKELLRNYEDRVSHMKNLLEREKDIWYTEKSRKEKELFTQRQDLVKLMEHVKEKKLKLKEALENIEMRKDSTNNKPTVTTTVLQASKLTDSSIGSSEADTSNTSDNKETSIKCFKLESTIKRLQEENKRLQRKLLQQHQPSNFKQYQQQQQENSLNSVKSVIDDDKIAFLQYTVEKQAEELQQLKEQLKSEWNNTNSLRQLIKKLNIKDSFSSVPLLDGGGGSSNSSSVLLESRNNKMGEIQSDKTNNYYKKQKTEKEDIDIETFLEESKRRFAEIEKKAETVGMSLREVFSKRIAKPSTPLNTTLGTKYKDYFEFSNNANNNDSDIPPSVPKIPPTLKHSRTGGGGGGSQALSQILAPRFMSTTSSSIDQALKSFLMNQTDDPFHSSVVKVPESSSLSSNHVRFLEPNQTYTKLQNPSTAVLSSQTNTNNNINNNKNVQTSTKTIQNSKNLHREEEYTFQLPMNDTLSKSNNNNNNEIWQKASLTNKLQVYDSVSESDEKFKNLNVIIESIDELVQSKYLIPPTLSTTTAATSSFSSTTTTTIANKEQLVETTVNTFAIEEEKERNSTIVSNIKSPCKNNDDNLVLHDSNNMKNEHLQEQLSTNKIDNNNTSINNPVIVSSTDQNVNVEVTTDLKMEQLKGIDTNNLKESRQETNGVIKESIPEEIPSHSKNQIQKSIKMDQDSTHNYYNKIKDPKELSKEATSASSSGALIQYKVPSPDNSESRYLKTTKLPESNTTTTTTTKKQESWSDILSKGKPITITKSSSSSSPSISVAPDDDFMTEEDFWVL